MAVIDDLVELLNRLPREEGACGLGVDVPGLARPNGTVWAPNVPGWERMPLGRLLSRRFKLPVVVESDRNAFVTGEAWKGVARNTRDVVFVAIGTGIGAGIISGGQLIRGSGEFPAASAGWRSVTGFFQHMRRWVAWNPMWPGLALRARLSGSSTATSTLTKL